MELYVAVFREIFMEFQEIREAFQEFFLTGRKIGFIEDFDCGGDNVQSKVAGIVLFLRNFVREFNQTLCVGDDKTLCEGFCFFVELDGAAERVGFFKIEKLSTGKDGRKKRGGRGRYEDKMMELLRFFEVLQEGVFGSFVHLLGEENDEIAVGFRLSFSQVCKIPDSFDGDFPVSIICVLEDRQQALSFFGAMDYYHEEQGVPTDHEGVTAYCAYLKDTSVLYAHTGKRLALMTQNFPDR